LVDVCFVLEEHMKGLNDIIVNGQSIESYQKSVKQKYWYLHCTVQKSTAPRYSLCSKKRARDKGAIKRRRILCKNCEILALGTTTISAAQLELDINLAVGGVRLSLGLEFCRFLSLTASQIFCLEKNLRKRTIQCVSTSQMLRNLHIAQLLAKAETLVIVCFNFTHHSKSEGTRANKITKSHSKWLPMPPF
jgi:hypothetical protein